MNGMNAAEHKRAVVVARTIYAVVILSFVSVCTVAVIVTMNMEKDKPGFRAITVEKPISFIDRTYLPESK
jgi:hypothetical protein